MNGRWPLVVGRWLVTPFSQRQPAIQPRTTIITVLCQTKLWQHECRGTQQMARKKKVKRFRAVQAVKELARERMGAHQPNGAKEKGKAFWSRAGRKRIGPGTHGRASRREGDPA